MLFVERERDIFIGLIQILQNSTIQRNKLNLKFKKKKILIQKNVIGRAFELHKSTYIDTLRFNIYLKIFIHVNYCLEATPCKFSNLI